MRHLEHALEDQRICAAAMQVCAAQQGEADAKQMSHCSVSSHLGGQQQALLQDGHALHQQALLLAQAGLQLPVGVPRLLRQWASACHLVVLLVCS